jgi:hypothetical protein
MKKNTVKLFVLALALGSGLTAFAQTPEERAEIVKHYDLKKNEELYQRLKRQEDESYKKALELAEIKGWPLEIEKEGYTSILTGVTEDNQPIYIKPYNDGARKTARVPAVQPGGLFGLNVTGLGMIIGIWEPGRVRASHNDLNGAVTVKDGATFNGPNDNNGHATHVSGTMIGRGVSNAAAKGLAYEAILWASDAQNDRSEAIARANEGLLVSNHSYGVDFDIQPEWKKGAYDSEAAAWDEVLVNHPYYLPVFAAGNDRVAEESNIIVGDGNAKNVVTAAACYEVDPYVNANSVQMSSFSSYGPTDDYRIKPDIATQGVAVFSCYDNNNSDYATLQGTSMAAPGITASLALMQQHYNNLNGNFMRAATVKGLMIHTADEAGTAPGPDHRFGWGLVNVTDAVLLITADNQATSALIQENILSQGDVYTINVTASESATLKATISWTDLVGPVNNGVEDLVTPVLVNDLDIRITKDGETFFPWKLTTSLTAVKADNIVDNVEVVEIDNPTAGAVYTITVTHKGILEGFAPQRYALIVDGITDVPASTSDKQISEFGVYPNPAQDVLNITLDNSLLSSVTHTILYDIQGRMVKDFGASKTNLDVSNVASGVYFLTVDVNNGAYTESKKIIIK